jgi:hypothetical protein
MIRFGDGAREALLAVAASAVLALAIVWLGFGGSSTESARDYEDCVELAQAKRSPSDELNAMINGCGARFAGRRKAGGGYTYYDFMQSKQFDIAGPNPTAEERKEIDRQYIVYLEAQRREAISAALAKQQNDMLRADIESARQPPGAPMALTPTNLASPPTKHAAERSKSKPCAQDSLLCSLSKLSGAVKDAFASSKTKN